MFGLNSVGRRTGEALVVLENQEQAVLALQRHRQYMNQRYVEVWRSVGILIYPAQIIQLHTNQYCVELESCLLAECYIVHP